MDKSEAYQDIVWVKKMKGYHKLSNNRDDPKHEHKCFECEHVPCINFYRKGNQELEGGEIYVLKDLIEKKKSFPCNTGSLIYTLCQLWSNLEGFPSHVLFFQCIRDLRASAYLLLSCHYRSSIQLLRPIIENCVTGLYWDAKFSLESQGRVRLDNVQQSFSDFLDDKYEIPISEWQDVFPNDERPKKKLDYDFCLSFMVRKEWISGQMKDEISKLVGELNKYLHPRGLKPMEIGRAGCPECPSLVKYQKNEYDRSIELFQDVTALMMYVFYSYLRAVKPKKARSEEIHNALSFTKGLEVVEKELGATLIFSKNLRTFLSQEQFSGFASKNG